MSKKIRAPLCVHCNRPAALTTGARIYPGRADLAAKNIWRCRCGAYVGCHGDTTRPLGRPANSDLRTARIKLHNMRVDPLWQTAVETGEYRPESPRAASTIRSAARSRVYAFLADRLGIEPKACHISEFDIETCRRAWVALRGITYPEIRAWARERKLLEAVGDHPFDLQHLKHAALEACEGCRHSWTLVHDTHLSGFICQAMTVRRRIDWLAANPTEAAAQRADGFANMESTP